MTPMYDAALYATDRRTLVFVDAGFLLTVMQAHHQVHERSRLVVHHPRLVEFLRSTAEELLGCPVLRIYWYDAAHPSNLVPNLVAAEMDRVDGVRVRLGTLHVRSDGRYQQKAVDTLLVRDMIAHAYKKTAQEMVLVSGDNDLIPGVEEAQEQGVRVHLWSIRGDDLPPSVGRRLTDLSDSRTELEARELAQSIAKKPDLERLVSAAPLVSPSSIVVNASAAATAATAAAASPGAPTDTESRTATASEPTPMPAQHARPSPATVAAVNPAALAASLRAQTPAVYARNPEEAFARLYDSDRDAYNAPVAGDDAVEVGIEYARRWMAAVDAEALQQIRTLHDPDFDGNIPRQIDSDLLYFGGDHGLDTYAQPKKFALRRGFWQGILGEHPGAL